MTEAQRNKIVEALGHLATVSNIPEVYRAETVLRGLLAADTARANEPREAAE